MLRRPCALCCHQRQDIETLRQQQIRTIYRSLEQHTVNEKSSSSQDHVNKIDDCSSSEISKNKTSELSRPPINCYSDGGSRTCYNLGARYYF